MNKHIRFIAGILAGVALSYNASAQDFYNGCRGPRPVQVDNYADYSDKKFSLTIIPKLFTKNLDSTLANIVLATPTGISSDGKIDNKGINIGGVLEGGYGSMIFAAGLFKDDNGIYNTFNPQIYITHEEGKFSLDIEASRPINLETGETSGNASMTLGYGLNDVLRFGGSITKGKDVSCAANIRAELDPSHKYWMQLYIRKNDARLRLAINL